MKRSLYIICRQSRTIQPPVAEMHDVTRWRQIHTRVCRRHTQQKSMLKNAEKSGNYFYLIDLNIIAKKGSKTHLRPGQRLQSDIGTVAHGGRIWGCVPYQRCTVVLLLSDLLFSDHILLILTCFLQQHKNTDSYQSIGLLVDTGDIENIWERAQWWHVGKNCNNYLCSNKITDMHVRVN